MHIILLNKTKFTIIIKVAYEYDKTFIHITAEIQNSEKRTSPIIYEHSHIKEIIHEF